MTSDEALTGIFEAATYCVENDEDYLSDEVIDRWTSAIEMLSDKKIVALSKDDIELLSNLLDTQREFAGNIGHTPTDKFLDLERRIKGEDAANTPTEENTDRYTVAPVGDGWAIFDGGEPRPQRYVCEEDAQNEADMLNATY